MPYFIQLMGDFKTIKLQSREMAQALTQLLTGGAGVPQMPQQQTQQQVQPQQAARRGSIPAPAPAPASGGFGFIG